MYQFGSNGPARAVRGAMGALALAACLGFSSAAAAIEITAMPNYDTYLSVDANPGAYSLYAAPFALTTDQGPLLAFCIDMYADPNTGSFHSDPNFLTGAVKTTVSQLVSFGTDLYLNHSGDTDFLLNLAAVQGAIWQVLSPTLTFTDANTFMPSAQFESQIQYYANNAGSLAQNGNTVTFLVDNGHTAQSLAFVGRVAAVPEPATWMMMILGVFSVGAVLRRRVGLLA